MLPIRVYETYPYPLHMVKCLGKQHESIFLFNIFVKRLSSITKKGEIKSPSLVLANWWNHCGLTFSLSVVIEVRLAHTKVELDGTYSDGDDQKMVISASTWKEEREKQNELKTKV